MLIRGIRRAWLAVFVPAVLLVLWQPSAWAQAAGGQGDGTSPFVSVQCGQGWTPSCTVSAGSPGSTQPAVGTSAPHGGTPPGCPVTVATVACLLSVPGPHGGGGVLPPPGTLARVAVRHLGLPGPVIRSSPAPGGLQLVGLPAWLWVAPAVWAPQSATASVPGEWVTATATPVSVSWQMGDGTTVACRGPGVPYPGSGDPASVSPDCGHTYTRSSAGQPGGAYRVTATITWNIRWAAADGAAGTLPPLFTAAAAAFRVAESQAVNTGGGQR